MDLFKKIIIPYLLSTYMTRLVSKRREIYMIKGTACRYALVTFLIALLIGGFVISPVSAAYSIGKYKNSGFNWQMTLTGNDLAKAKTPAGAAYYSNKAANWVVDTYFGPLNLASGAEKIGLPKVATLSKTGIKAGIAAKIYSLITANAKKTNKKLEIWTVAPPFPAKWKVGIHN